MSAEQMTAMRRHVGKPPAAGVTLRVVVREGGEPTVLGTWARAQVAASTLRDVVAAVDEWVAESARQARARVEWLGEDGAVVASRPLVRSPVEPDAVDAAEPAYDGTPLDLVRQAQAHQERMARLYGSMVTTAMQQVAQLARHATEMHGRAMQSVARAEDEADALRVELTSLREAVAQAQGAGESAQPDQLALLGQQVLPLLMAPRAVPKKEGGANG